MTKVICDMAVSVDGFTAGPNQSADKPFGDGAVDRLTSGCSSSPRPTPRRSRPSWRRARSSWGATCSAPIAESGTRAGRVGGATSRPTTGPSSCSPTGRASRVEMQGGTTFTFVTDGIESALAQAREAAGSADVAIAGGASTVNQYLAAGAIDELRLHVAPVVLGVGERLFDGVGALSLEPVGVNATDLVTHLTYRMAHEGRPG